GRPRAMLKAHSRLFEHLTLGMDLVLIAACWLSAYWLRFYVVGPPLVTPVVPPLGDYLLQLSPIVVVWGFAFHWFDLYRPRRLGSHLAEWVDVAKASTLGALVLVAIMAFVFKGHEYSRVVILYFWAMSIVAVSLWRATFREILRAARRAGHNVRRAVIVGGGGPAAGVVAAPRHRPDTGVRVVGAGRGKSDQGAARGARPWRPGSGASRTCAPSSIVTTSTSSSSR